MWQIVQEWRDLADSDERWRKAYEVEHIAHQIRSFSAMSLSDTQIFIALVVALIPGVMAFRLSTELYK